MKNLPLSVYIKYIQGFLPNGLIVSFPFCGRRAIAILTEPNKSLWFYAAVNYEGDGSMDEDKDGDFHRVWWADEPVDVTIDQVQTATQAEVNKLVQLGGFSECVIQYENGMFFVANIDALAKEETWSANRDWYLRNLKEDLKEVKDDLADISTFIENIEKKIDQVDKKSTNEK